MLLFSPPRHDYLLGAGKGEQTAFTTRRLSLPIWPTLSSLTSTAASPQSRRSSTPSFSQPSAKANTVLQSTPSRQQPHIKSPNNMHCDHHASSPRFSPTLGSIPEVAESETQPRTARRDSHITIETPGSTPEAFIPEITLNPPKISMKNAKGAIVQVTKKVIKAYDVTGVLRKVLEADQIRRRRILKIYLKALVFLKYLWDSSDRYGAIMQQSGFRL